MDVREQKEREMEAKNSRIQEMINRPINNALPSDAGINANEGIATSGSLTGRWRRKYRKSNTVGSQASVVWLLLLQLALNAVYFVVSLEVIGEEVSRRRSLAI
jgi:hypothetical protein